MWKNAEIFGHNHISSEIFSLLFSSYQFLLDCVRSKAGQEGIEWNYFSLEADGGGAYLSG